MDIKILGDKIALARKENRMSQAQLAQLLFISPQAVGKWERGESLPDFITINRLAEIFSLELAYFSEDSRAQKKEYAMKDTTNVNNEKVQEKNNPSADNIEPLLTNFNGVALVAADFAGVSAPTRKFIGSDLKQSDFSDADLTGSSFKNNDMRAANFEAADLTDCIISGNNLSDTNFNKTILFRTAFSASEFSGARFTDVRLANVKIASSDLRKAIFENCEFESVDFRSSDMSGLCLDGQSFTNVKFDNAGLNGTSFKGTALKNVSFRSTFALTNRYYKALRTIDFEGATMDKLTYAVLKGIGVDLSKVIKV